MPKVLRSRAFDAFVPDSEPGEELSNARLLPLDVIDPNPYQARQAFAPEKLEELASSIRAHGVLEPILVQAVDGERYRILAGERRYRAARAAGFTQIPAIIREDLSEAEAAFITATENLQRADLDIEDEARQFAYLLTLTGLSQRALAEKLGIGFNYLSRRVRLLERPDLLAAVRSGHLPLLEALKRLDAPVLPDGVYLTDTNSQPGSTPSPAPATSSLYLADTNSQPGSSTPVAPAPNSELYLADTNSYPGSNTTAGSFTTPRSNFAPGSDDPAGLVERADLDDPDGLLGDPEADLDPAPAAVPRWRYVEDAHRALRRIDVRAIPPPERLAWVRQVTLLETLVADLKRRLLALDGGPPDAV